MTGMVQLAVLLAVVGALLWASATVNLRFRAHDATWQRTQRKLVAGGKGVLSTGLILLALVLVVAAITALT